MADLENSVLKSICILLKFFGLLYVLSGLTFSLLFFFLTYLFIFGCVGSSFLC